MEYPSLVREGIAPIHLMRAPSCLRTCIWVTKEAQYTRDYQDRDLNCYVCVCVSVYVCVHVCMYVIEMEIDRSLLV